MTGNKAILAEAAASYPPRLPKVVPEGKKLVHNSVLLPSRRQGWRGSRYWLADAGAPNLVACDCGWAKELGQHFRVGARTVND
jgi:hypothetical protein